MFRGSRPKELDRSRTKLPARNWPIRLHVVPEVHLVPESNFVAVRASFWRPVLPVTFAAMPYNAARLRSATAADAWYSNFLQFSDNFGLAALVRHSGWYKRPSWGWGQWRCPRWAPHKMGPCYAAMSVIHSILEFTSYEPHTRPPLSNFIKKTLCPVEGSISDC